MNISLQNITYSYPNGTLALDGVSVDIPKNKNIAFLGANGSGKSSLFLLLAGLLQPQTGTYSIEGTQLSLLKQSRRGLSQKVGLVFQDPDVQILASTVYKEVAYGPANLSLPLQEIERRVETAMHICGIEHLRNRNPQSLSFGQKKAIAIASILAMETETVIFDEPLAWLDPLHKKEMLKTLAQLKKHGKTVLVSTHNTDFAYEWADEVYILDSGRVVSHGVPAEVFSDIAMLQSAHLVQPLVYKLSQITGTQFASEADFMEWIKEQSI